LNAVELQRPCASLHSGVAPFGSGHEFVGHWFIVGSHVTSHLHALAQLTAPHALPALHAALHAPVPHVSVPHAALPPPQVVVQSPLVQRMSLHAALPEQVAVQLPVDEHVKLPHALLP
jgi:hypothetical protein